MCAAVGIYGERAADYWQRKYELNKFPEHDWKSYNIRPSQETNIIVRNSPTKMVRLQFGIKAPWNDKQLLINAQSETVAEKRSFVKMFREGRGILPADVFYEWKKLHDGKQPYAFALKNEETMSIAVIHNDEGFVILTTSPNHLMEDVHNRMPCLIKDKDIDDWLNPDTEDEQLLKMLSPYPDSEMKKWPISSLVNKPQNNFPEVLKEVKAESFF